MPDEKAGDVISQQLKCSGFQVYETWVIGFGVTSRDEAWEGLKWQGQNSVGRQDRKGRWERNWPSPKNGRIMRTFILEVWQGVEWGELFHGR